jgi:sporulation-control protein spo0M|tara:strand:+ start:177 stop:416 length:240 start_codon:yes stop_codon:yes gene_type:complete
MSKPQYNYQHGYNETNSIALIWCIDDVKQMAAEMEIPVKLTDEQCMDILYEVDRRHDASLGVSWDTIEYNIENYFQDYK